MRELALIVPLAARDADGLADIAARCISECCVLDHGGSPALVAAWVEQFSAARLREMIGERGSYGVAVVADSLMLGAAILSRAGSLRLCVVDPRRHQRGVGRRLMATIEHEARRRWVTGLAVDSTATAAPFFFHLGFDAADAKPVEFAGVILTPMWKPLPR